MCKPKITVKPRPETQDRITKNGDPRNFDLEI